MMKVDIKDEYIPEEKGSETKIINIKTENAYQQLKQEKEKDEDYSKNVPSPFFLDKLFIIRAMIILAFLVFCYYFINLIKKGSKIYIIQNNIFIQKELTDLKLIELKSHQLINEKNIEIIKQLNISINIEHSKYVHLSIKDFNKKRWEVPKEILNEEYFKTLNNNTNNPLNFQMEYSQTNDNFYFYLYFNSKNSNGKVQKNIFYTFNTSNNFLFSNNYINFESHLTSDDIMGLVKESIILN